ncbi:MAG: hypothetical protein ACPG5Z_13805, partial [Pseudoalteromonas sp.]
KCFMHCLLCLLNELLRIGVIFKKVTPIQAETFRFSSLMAPAINATFYIKRLKQLSKGVLLKI